MWLFAFHISGLYISYKAELARPAIELFDHNLSGAGRKSLPKVTFNLKVSSVEEEQSWSKYCQKNLNRSYVGPLV